MAVEVLDAEKLAKSQAEKIACFFGAEIPEPGDWLFETAERNRQEELLAMAPFYLPKRQLAEGISFPGLKRPLDSWLYSQIKAGTVDPDADWLPGEWVLFDTTKRPDYNNGKQMYKDTPRFKGMLAMLRERSQITVPNAYEDVPRDSRFAVSADEIDGSSAAVARAVADILHIQVEQVSTPLYSSFNYIGNLAHPELGQANTWEWFRNNFGGGSRLFGGDSDHGGLSGVSYSWSGRRFDSIGFRLQVSSPAGA